MLLILSFVCMCFLGMGTTHAQVTTADIVGNVTDSTGAVVTSASVTATNTSTGEVKTATVSGSGTFQFSLLQVGSYKVTIEAPGFKVYATQLTLAVGDRARIDAALALGESTQTINVETITPALQSDTSTIGMLITKEAVQDLPLNGRNLLNLVTLGAGVTGGMENGMASGTNPNDRRPASNFSVNGQSDVNNNNLIDGMDNNERFLGGVGVRPSVEAVDQVQVFTNLYTAEISRTAGGVVDLITKSGTNQFHGSAYEYLRNDALDARNYFSRGPRPEFRQNQFGVSIGGPIKKDKAFFFFDYEGFRMIQGRTQTSTVPTLYEENNPGDFTDLGPTCVKIAPSKIQTIGLNYFKLYPAPNVPVAIPTGTACTPPLNNGSYTLNQTQFATTYDSKVDYRFSSKDSAFARFAYNTTDSFLPGNYPIVNGVNPGAGSGGTFAGPANQVQLNGALSYTHVFTSHLTLELDASYMRINNQSSPVNVGKSVATDFGYPCTPTSCVNLPGQVLSSGLPPVSFTQGYGPLGDAGYVPLQTLDNTFQYMGSVLWLKGAHSIKMGGGLIRRQGTYVQSQAARGTIAFQASYTGNSLGDLLTNQAAQLTRAETIITPTMRAWESAVYIADDWRLRKNLTVNLGVRYDVYTPLSTANGGITNFDPSQSLLVGPNLPAPQNSSPTAGVKVDYGDVAPRVGFAYTAAPGMVVRGGYGLTYYMGNQTSQAQMKNAPYTYTFVCGSISGANNSCPAAYANPSDGKGYLLSTGMPIPTLNVASVTTPAGYANTSINATDFNFKASYIQQYSLNLEKELKGNLLTLAYVGNHGSRLATYLNINQLPYFGAPRPFPTLPSTTIGEFVTSGTSNYNALQTTFERRMKNGFAANINYTFSKGLTNGVIPSEGGGNSNCSGQCHVDNGSGQAVTYNSYFQYEYGPSYLDTRHRATVSLVYDLLFLGSSFNGAKAVLAKGWSLASVYYWQTGQPFTVTNANGNQSAIGLSSDRPNMVSSGQPGFQRSLSEWYDVSRFRLQGQYLLGDESHNALYGPDSQALALSGIKMFPIHENIKLQFRAESFNLFNTPSFNNPSSTIHGYTNGIGSSPTDAAISSTRPSSIPRQLQFALRLIF
jgi:outer membrane receptor protein involved in Fe transport